MWRIFSVVSVVIMSTNGYSQVSESPFTAQGIGEVQDLSMVHNDGMGGIGISTGSLWYMNAMNPALLPLNTLTVFGAGFNTERRSVSTADESSVSSGGNLSYLGTALPVKTGRWTTAIGLAPYSTVNYEYTKIQNFEGSTGEAILTRTGIGGFNQFYWGNGVKFGKDFFLGARATYLFSSITEESSNLVVDTTMTLESKIAIFDRISVSDFMFSAGAAFSKDSLFNKNIRLTVGVTYDFAAEINANAFKTLERRNITNIALESDTLLNEDGSIYLPSKYGFGFTLAERLNWQVSLEMQMQGWSEYKNFTGGNDNLSDGIRVALGGEYTPDYSSVTNYFKRISYRAGFSYELLPYTLNNNQVKEVGINFGLSLPVSRFSSIDLAVKYANRGNIAETSMQENVVNFGLGITFNDQWFIRRKYD